jgi:beta-glucosidase
MANGPNKLSKVDLTAALRAALGKGWTNLQVRLSCFHAAGADMRTITAPMVLTTAGKLAIDLDFVKVAEGVGASSCPVAVSM